MSVISSAVINDKIKPILVNWEHGNTINENLSSVQCQVLHSKNSDKITPIITTTYDNNVFVGDKESSKLCTNYLVICNKSSNQLRLYAADDYFMSRFQANNEDPEISVTTGNTASTSTFGEDIRNLNKAFASKKIKRRTAEFEKTNIKTEDIQNNLATILENQAALDNSEESIDSGDSSFLPPCDRNASCIELAYNLHNIVSPDELESVHNFAQMITNDINNNLHKKYSEFLNYMIKSVPVLDMKKLKILLIINAFIEFLKVPYKVLISKKPVICDYSSLVNKKILDKFCINSAEGRCRPDSMRDKTLCYILVLLFIIYGYTMNIGVLSSFINKFDYKRVPILLQAIGARSVKTCKTTYELRVPLPSFSTDSVNEFRAFKRKR